MMYVGAQLCDRNTIFEIKNRNATTFAMDAMELFNPTLAGIKMVASITTVKIEHRKISVSGSVNLVF
jgi:hypothetical protein